MRRKIFPRRRREIKKKEGEEFHIFIKVGFI